MKRANIKRIAIALAILSFPALAGCGSSSNNSVVPAAAVVPTTVGTTVGGYAGCGAGIPINYPISFTVSNMVMGYGKVYAGLVPQTATYGMQIPYQTSGFGTVQLTGTGTALTVPTNIAVPPTYAVGTTGYGYPYSGMGYGTEYLTGYGVDGSALQIQTTFNPTGTVAAGAITATGGGTLSLSPTEQQLIVSAVSQNPALFGVTSTATTVGTTYPYGTTYPTGTYPYGTSPYGTSYPYGIQAAQICVTGMAFSLNVTNADNIQFPNRLYMGDVYLYLNNTPHGYDVNTW